MTLTQVAALTKQAITVTIIAIFLGLVSFIGYKIWYAYYLAHLPPVEEKPDLKFGQLPLPDFPTSSVSSSNYSYSLDTATGNLPKVGIDPGFEKIIKVYFITKTYATLLSGEKSKALAAKFSITTPPQVLSETNYLFQDKEKSLNVDLDTGNFLYKNDATVSGQENLDDDNKLVSDFRSQLQVLGVLNDDLKNGTSRVNHIKNGNTTLAQVSLWPPAIDKRPILTSDYNSSNVLATIYKSGAQLENYLLINFTYYPVDLSTFATYPLKNAATAFDDLKNGKGIIIVEPDKSQVSVTTVYLAYYLSKNYSAYLQPIYVFEGPHFVAYVAAIDSQFQTATK